MTHDPWEDDDEHDVDTKVMGGIRLACYFAPSRAFHIGGYFSFMKGEMELEDRTSGTDVKAYSAGLTVKTGGVAGQRFWIGAAFDLGGAFWDADRSDKVAKGVVFFPRLQMDVLFVGGGSFKMAGFFSVGPQIYPYLVGEDRYTRWDSYYEYYKTNVRDAKTWAIQLTALFGVTLGG